MQEDRMRNRSKERGEEGSLFAPKAPQPLKYRVLDRDAAEAQLRMRLQEVEHSVEMVNDSRRVSQETLELRMSV